MLSVQRHAVYAAKIGQMPREYDCRENWERSAKAMEPGIVAEMVRKANEMVSIGTLVGNDDTTSIAKFLADVDKSSKYSTAEMLHICCRSK